MCSHVGRCRIPCIVYNIRSQGPTYTGKNWNILLPSHSLLLPTSSPSLKSTGIGDISLKSTGIRKQLWILVFPPKHSGNHTETVECREVESRAENGGQEYISKTQDPLHVNTNHTRDLVLVCLCREGGFAVTREEGLCSGCHGGRSGRSSHPSFKRLLSLRAARGGPVGVI